MAQVTKDTLQQVAQELPALPWPDRDLEELVAPSFGVITAFQDFVEQVRGLATIDLGESGLPGALRPKD